MSRNRRVVGILFFVVLCVGAHSALHSQASAAKPKPVDQRLEELEERLTGVEKTIAGLLPVGERAAPTIGPRLNQLETRVSRLEADALRYRPGAPMTGSLPMIESRLRALESEVARLRR